MQEFLTNNTVSCNLMSLTGYRTLVILKELLKSPKTADEINECLLNDQYIKEKFFSDTLRLYINSLRAIGCDITKATRSSNQKYILLKHPFGLTFKPSELKALKRLYKNIYDKIDVYDILAIEKAFDKILKCVQDTEIIEFFAGISLLKDVNKDILKELINCVHKKQQFIFSYNSPHSGEKKIEIIADKLFFKSEKLYIAGCNINSKEYSYFPLNRINKILGYTLNSQNLEITEKKVIFQTENLEYKLNENEEIIEKFEDKIIISSKYKNEFIEIQKFLYLGNDVKILEPKEFKEKLIAKLCATKEVYYES